MSVTTRIRTLVLMLLALAVFVPGLLHAQGMSGGKGKGPILHEIIFGQYNNPGNMASAVLGPFAADTILEVFAITSVNPNQSPIGVRLRVVEPDTEPGDLAGCKNIPAGVRDEVSTAIIPPYSTVHLTFPEGIEVPGDTYGDASMVNEPEGPWCLMALADGLGIASDGDTFSGRIYFRKIEAE